MNFIKNYGFHFSILILFGIRLFHLGPEIDNPHDWRQSDTAYYIWDFLNNGIDLFYPSVCWMGDYEHIIFEFPLPEAIVAAIQNITGESMLVSRLVFLAFFCGALYYFFRIAQFFFGDELAKIAAIIYLALPLSLFYSRAIHIDFFVLWFAHALLYYFLKGVQKRSEKYILLSVLMSIPAILVKAPYVFCFLIPMGVFIIREKATGWILTRGLLYLIPLILFLLWQQHVYAVNSMAPDWDFILHYRKFDNNAHWYFGDLARRMALYPWKILTLRTLFEVAGFGSILFVVLGFLRLNKINNGFFITSLIFGFLLYVLTFFNLNVIHNYYQLPLLSLFALLAAFGVRQISQSQLFLQWISLLFLIIINVYYAEKMFYKVPVELIEIAELVQQNSEDDDLVIITYKKQDCRNPRILSRARRRGWSIEQQAASFEVIERLKENEKADYWFYFGKNSYEKFPQNTNNGFVEKVFPLKYSDGNLYRYNLNK